MLTINHQSAKPRTQLPAICSGEKSKFCALDRRCLVGFVEERKRMEWRGLHRCSARGCLARG